MASGFYLVCLLTIIAIQTPTSEARKCNVGETCMEKDDCPEYQRYMALPKGPQRNRLAKTLTENICNRSLQMLCCKGFEIEDFEIESFKSNPNSTSSTCEPGSKIYPPSKFPPKGQCGVACVGSSSVVHGEDASLGEFPWAALLMTETVKKDWDNRRKEWVNKTEKLYHCGDTLINTWFVLTAAHCHKTKTQISEVVLGEWSTLSDPDCTAESSSSSCDNPKVQRREVAKVIIHGSYDPYNTQSPNDIALIRMKTKAVYNIFVQPTCLPLPEYRHFSDHKSATVVGWGVSDQVIVGSVDTRIRQKHGIYTRKLQKGEFDILPPSECDMITSTQICAGNDKTKTDSCLGDSGGGLFINSGVYPGQSFGNVHVQVGVVSITI